MKKADLIEEVSIVSKQPETVVRSVLDATCDVVRLAASRGEPVMLFGLGKLHPVQRQERMARNLHTGESITVPPDRFVRFTPSVGLLRSANGL